MIKLSNILKEVEVAQGHENDRDMVVGVAEILRMVDDMNNRKEIADAMLRKFKSEEVMHNVAEFLTLCGL
jgi:methyltransferase-like protein